MSDPRDAAAESTAAAQFGLPFIALVAAVAFALSGAGPQTVWYVVRATGILSYVLVTLTVVGGLLVSNRSLRPGRPRVDVYEAHRFLSLLTISAAGFHALSLLLDTYIGFSPSQVLLPFTSAYRPVAVALGIMALYTAIAVYASFYLKRWIGQAAWRTLHYASFGIFALASYHGILSGADTATPWMLAIYLVAISSVLGLLVYRIMKASEPAAQPAPAARPKARGQAAAPGPVSSFVGDLAWRPPSD